MTALLVVMIYGNLNKPGARLSRGATRQGMALYLVLFSLHAYIGWRLVPALPPAWQAALLVWLVLSALLMPMALLARRLRKPPWSDRLAWVGLLAMGLFSSLFVLTVLRDLLSIGGAALALVIEAPAWLSAWSQDSAMVVLVLALLLTLWGLLNARRSAKVVYFEVPIANLTPA
jgi:hypothetical protein